MVALSAPVADVVVFSESSLMESFSSCLFWLLPWLRFLMVKTPASSESKTKVLKCTG